MVQPKIAPSVLSSDFANLASECYKVLEYGADYLHLGAPVVQSLRKHTDAFFGDIKAILQKIKQKNMKTGLSIKPNTPTNSVYEYVDADLVDQVLVMSVEPGFGGQKFQHSSLEKIRTLREKYPHLDIEVDGGIDMENIELVANAGANVIVAGSSIFNADDPRQVIQHFKNTMNKFKR